MKLDANGCFPDFHVEYIPSISTQLVVSKDVKETANEVTSRNK